MAKTQAIAVWTVAVGAVPEDAWPRLAAVLDDAERERAARFRLARHRREHIAAHALKRLMLAAVGGRPARSWTFETAPGGKPYVAGLRRPCFNLSHCEGLAACAVSSDVEVGVDVEPVARKAPLELARTHFAPAEERWLEALPVPERRLAFFRLWTLKEAFIKATGRGLAQPLKEFAFGFDPLQVTFDDPALGEPGAWRFEQHVMGAHMLALAWRGGPAETSVSIRSVQLEAVLADGAKRA